MDSLWCLNTPPHFWHCQPTIPGEVWQEAIQKAVPVLGLPHQPDSIETVLDLVLGEGQFGPDHWRLPLERRVYYMLKPILPSFITDALKKLNSQVASNDFPLDWPIESRYARFQWEVMRQILTLTGRQTMPYLPFWPGGYRFAFVLTHDVETARGQAHVRAVADLEERYGLRSCFNFVPERYSLDRKLMVELKERGFEIGVHGLKHDGKLFSSQRVFVERAQRINHYLKEFGAVGFRAPYTHRHPQWMQALEIEYDTSFYDTDPYEPLPGGGMSIWPYWIGHFVELPYTLIQDSTLAKVLGESTPRLWLEKVAFIEQYHGMALVNTHPDYLCDAKLRDIYESFLQVMREKQNYWHPLPHEAARWWRSRSQIPLGGAAVTPGQVALAGDQIELIPNSSLHMVEEFPKTGGEDNAHRG